MSRVADGRSPSAGWYPDPHGSGVLRWWDGFRWSEQLAPAPYPGPSYPASTYATPGRRPLPMDTPVYTVWIWLVALLPLLGAVQFLFLHPQPVFRSAADGSPVLNPDPFAMLGGPIFFVGSVLSWLVTAAVIVFAWLDYRELGRRGVERPFHWAWSFLGIVYPIGRTVIVRRVAAGRGLAPLWVSIAAQVLLVVFVSVWSVMLVAQIIGTATQNVPLGT